MSTSSREIVFLILQFLDEEKFKDTVHMLAKETGFYFDLRYLEDAVTNGEWDEVDKYVSGFTNVGDNPYSTKIIFEIRKQKYVEALDKHDYGKASEILRNSATVFPTYNDDLVREMILHSEFPNFRKHNQLSNHDNTNTARAVVLAELKKLIAANPLLRDKLQFPSFQKSRLRTLLNQSLNWQHHLCKNPNSNPDIKTLFTDHTCGEPNDAQAPYPIANQLTGSMPKPLQPGPDIHSGGWMGKPSTMLNPGISGGTISLSTSNNADPENVLNRGPFGLLDRNGGSQTLPDVKPRITDQIEKCTTWKVVDINDEAQLRSLRLPTLLSGEITRLIYTNSGGAILALAFNDVLKLWKWKRNEQNLGGEATTSVPPQFQQPSRRISMTYDMSETSPEKVASCLARSNNDLYVVSASRRREISLCDMKTFKTIRTFMPPPPGATFLAFHPQDDNIIAIGMGDSSVQIYHIPTNEVKSKLEGHQKRVTGLAFSTVLNVLVSSGADAQICVWDMDGWKKQGSTFLQMPSGQVPTPLGKARVQFHQDQTHLLIVHETQIAIYKAPMLKALMQWVPRESSGSIADATYSCDSQSIYVTATDGSIIVFTETLNLRCRISPTAYLHTFTNSQVYPLVIAANPKIPNQFALGLNDGDVHVLEPLESEGKWGTMPPHQNGAGPSRIVKLESGPSRSVELESGPSRSVELESGPSRSVKLESGPSRSVKLEPGLSSE